jgi:hypothetical protein
MMASHWAVTKVNAHDHRVSGTDSSITPTNTNGKFTGIVLVMPPELHVQEEDKRNS